MPLTRNTPLAMRNTPPSVRAVLASILFALIANAGIVVESAAQPAPTDTGGVNLDVPALENHSWD